MPVPTLVSELSTTAGSNSPSGSDSPTVADDHLRAAYAFIAQHRDGIGFTQEATIASASTVDIGASTSLYVQITGTTTITSFGTAYNGPRFLRFAGVLTLTHNATTLIIPGGASITTATGDTCVVVPNGNAASGWRVVSYTRAALAPGNATNATNATGPAASTTTAGLLEVATDAEAQAGTDTSRAITAANLKAAQIQLGTAVTLTNQTAVDFTGIPSWAKRITVLFSGVSTNGTSNPVIQIGDSGGIENTGYLGASSSIDSAVATSNYTTGFGIRSSLAASVLNGSMVIEKISGNTWEARGVFGLSSAAATIITSGSKSLSDVLDRVRIFTGNGTDQYDAGSINISWE